MATHTACAGTFRVVTALVLIGAVSVDPASAQAGAVADLNTTASRADAVFAEFAKPSSPGCSVGVYQDERIVYERAFGMANLDHDVALTPASVFHVASVSKQFTAAAILLLAQEGKLSIDDDIRKYVPELPDFGHKITIRQLANHTSGIRDQWALLGLAGWRYSRDLITDEDVLELLSRQKDLNFTPGDRNLYSNSGYTLLAVIVSRVSGRSFREFTTERIFKPLGMLDTHFRDDFSEIVKNQAYGYAPSAGTFRLSVTNFDTAGATSLLTTVGDLARWHRNFDSPTVGGDTLVAGLLERGVLNDGRTIDYAFGVVHGTYRGLATVSHNGADAGYRAAFVRFPDQRFGVATLCNLATANPTALSYRVVDIFLADKLKGASVATSDEAEVPLTSAQLARYAGHYWNRTDWISRRVVLENGGLYLLAGSDRVPMKPIGDQRFALTPPGGRIRVSFEEAAGGTLRLRTGSDPSGLFERLEPFVPTPADLEAFVGVYRSDEMDAVFRITSKGAGLKLERTKTRPAALEPIETDIFMSQAGALRFVRNSDGRVSGFTLEAGRVVGVKFWKDTRSRPVS
jgi:CubicO group peptidase (beta-lactamase class C family)